jgi:hypothetical protein
MPNMFTYTLTSFKYKGIIRSMLSMQIAISTIMLKMTEFIRFVSIWPLASGLNVLTRENKIAQSNAKNDTQPMSERHFETGKQLKGLLGAQPETMT